LITTVKESQLKENAGILTSLAVVLALFGVANLPRSSSGGTGGATPANERGNAPREKVTESSNSTADHVCRKIQEQLQVLVADKLNQASGAPQSCYTSSKTANEAEATATDVSFVIATVPNPVSTHLALVFDRMVETIEQAAQDNGYSYDSSWFPWNDNKDYSRYPDQLAAEGSQSRSEEQPGVMVFRKPLGPDEKAPYKGGLVVFLVAELPTGGINRYQFENAVEWIHLRGGLTGAEDLKILGPSFSGSLPSLYQFLNSVTFFKGRIRVSSGTVSSDSSYHWFKDQLKERGTFDTALEGDCVALNRFVAYVKDENYDKHRIAVLSEDETAFGGSAVVPDDSNIESQNGRCTYDPKLTYLYYPRDIATLRSAYEQQAIFGSGKQASNDPNVPAITLRGDLSEPKNSEHDTVRTYSDGLTALAQESVLLSITDVLRAKNIQFVILRSTNSLDQIFLSQFLRRLVPEARIVIDGADLLLRRGSEGAALRGVMVLSTYPLLTWQQDWTSELKGGYRIFGQDNVEGLYIAARELLQDPKKTHDSSQIRIANYSPPRWARSADANEEDNHRPPTWLTVIGNHNFWPVAVLNAVTLRKIAPAYASVLRTATQRNAQVISIAGDSYPLQDLPVEFKLLLIVCAGCGAAHMLWCRSGSISPRAVAFRLASFAPIPRWQHPALIGFGSWLVAAFALTVSSASGVSTWELNAWNWPIVLWTLLVVALASLACVANYKLPITADVDHKKKQSLVGRKPVAVYPILCMIGFAGLQLAFILGLHKSNRIPTFWRSVHLLSGVSPLVPQLLLMVGLYCWFWFALRGLALFGDDRPMLPMKADVKLMEMFSREVAQEPVEEEGIPAGKRYFYTLIGIGLIVLVVWVAMFSDYYLRTLGERAFGLYMSLWLILFVSLILTDTAQCWLVWRRLHDLLVNLNRLPLRRTLHALRGQSWRSVWAMSGNVLAERYSLCSRQLEAMRHLANSLEEWRPADEAVEAARKDLGKRIADCQETKVKKFVNWYTNLNKVNNVTPLRDLQKEFAAISALTAERILVPAWRAEKDSLMVRYSDPRKPDADNDTVPLVSAKIAPHVSAAEEFFVLLYVGFLQNTLGRIRTIALGSLSLFVAMTIAVSSYPFDPLPKLAAVFLAVFVIIGTTMILIYASMHRDAALSYITGSEPGELGGQFWRQLITFGIGPLLGLLTTLFPSIADFVFSWVQPGSQVIK